MGDPRVVLVVDDDYDIRALITQILQLEGYHVLSAPDGRAALAKLRAASQRPAVILLDLMMPGMNGWQLQAELVKDPSLAGIPVLVLSGDDDVVHKAVEIGAAGWLKKPLDLKTLLRTVGKYC